MKSHSLAFLADDGLPQNIVDHFPVAESVAEKNLSAIKIVSKSEITSIKRQLDAVMTPSVPSANKLNRLRFLASEWQKIFSSKTACSSGCSHCCNIDVGLSRQEATLISKKIGVPLSKPATVKTLIDSTSSSPVHVGTPCTFLKEGRCQIFAHRPIMCMTLVNMDSTPLLCQLRADHMVPVPYLNAVDVQLPLVKITMNDDFADIRDWFPNGIA